MRVPKQNKGSSGKGHVQKRKTKQIQPTSAPTPDIEKEKQKNNNGNIQSNSYGIIEGDNIGNDDFINNTKTDYLSFGNPTPKNMKEIKKIDYLALEDSIPVEKPIAKTPEENPEFQEIKARISEKAIQQKQHQSASQAVNSAQQASPIASNEQQGKAQSQQVKIMASKEAGMFSAEAIAKELEKSMGGMELPKNEKEADNFEEHNNIQEINEGAKGEVQKHKQQTTNAIEGATKVTPNEAKQSKRKVTALPKVNIGKAPTIPMANKAVPKKRSTTNIEKPLQAESSSIDSQMESHGITEATLANSNEPTFKNALTAKENAKLQAQQDTQQFRSKEEQLQQQTGTEAQQQTNAQLAEMYTTRVTGIENVTNNQKNTAQKDSAARKEVATTIHKKYETTKTKVETLLKDLDDSVSDQFDKASDNAKTVFEEYCNEQLIAYKKKRYGESWGGWKRIRDVLRGLPEEVNKIYEEGKNKYINEMKNAIVTIASTIAGKLNEAKETITKGKKEIQEYVKGLSPELQKLGKQEAQKIQGKFKKLEGTIDAKKENLVDTLAEKYAENIAGVDKRIAELKEKNKGIFGGVLDAFQGVFDMVLKIKTMLLGLLSSAADVIQAIIADPIGFFKNLATGVGQGFKNFGTNIWKHLKTGFFSWLTGAMKGVSFTVPENPFSLKGIFSMSIQLLGLGWQEIRAIGARVISEPVMKALEIGLEIVMVIKNEGISGLWEYLKGQFQDLKATVMDSIMNIIQTKVIQAGIKWILGLLTPVGAFIKAAMGIIDAVKFFIQRAAQIMELVQAFIDSVAAIAAGKVGAVANAIEKALGRGVPVLIGLLASVLGISGLANKVMEVIHKIRKRVEKGITDFWVFVKKKGKALLSKLGIRKKKKKNKEENDWDDTKVSFKATDNHQHTLYFDTKGDQTVLMIASTPITFEQFIEDIDIENTDDKMVKAKNDAKKIAIKIDKRKKEPTGGDKVEEKKKEDDIKRMTKELSERVAILLGIEGGLPESEIDYGSVKHGLGTKMDATILTRNGDDDPSFYKRKFKSFT